MRPHAWLSNEWFSPDSAPGIAFPFYLAHPRLMRLERKMIIDVEGGTRTACMRILRHEAGHVVQHAYALAPPPPLAAAVRPSSNRYPSYYRPNPASRQFRPASAAVVRAEPSRRGLRRDLRGLADAALELAQALRRLAGAEEAQYVDELMAEIAGKRPVLTQRDQVDPLRTFTATLGEHYENKLEHYPVDPPRPTTATCCACSPPTRASPRRAGGGLHPPPPRRACAAGRQMDRRVSVHARCGARRHDRALPRAQAARGRPGAAAAIDFTVLLTAKTVHSLYSPSRRRGSRYETAPRPGADASGPGAAGLAQGPQRAGHQRLEDRVRRGQHLARRRPRGAAARRQDELAPIRDAVESWKPHVVFNLLEEFHGEAVYDQNVVSYLELLRVPYTGCNPRGLVLARGKDSRRSSCITIACRCRPSRCFRCGARSSARARLPSR